MPYICGVAYEIIKMNPTSAFYTPWKKMEEIAC